MAHASLVVPPSCLPRPHSLHAPQADIFQLDFMVAPEALEELEFNLKVDERVLRYLIRKKEALPPLPNTYKVQKLANSLLTQDPAAHQVRLSV